MALTQKEKKVRRLLIKLNPSEEYQEQLEQESFLREQITAFAAKKIPEWTLEREAYRERARILGDMIDLLSE